MTLAMYFGVRHAVSRVNADADRAGLLITGTGDVFAQGGGLQIAMCSDVAVVSERATFRVPELYRGIADTFAVCRTASRPLTRPVSE